MIIFLKKLERKLKSHNEESVSRHNPINPNNPNNPINPKRALVSSPWVGNEGSENYQHYIKLKSYCEFEINSNKFPANSADNPNNPRNEQSDHNNFPANFPANLETEREGEAVRVIRVIQELVGRGLSELDMVLAELLTTEQRVIPIYIYTYINIFIYKAIITIIEYFYIYIQIWLYVYVLPG